MVRTLTRNFIKQRGGGRRYLQGMVEVQEKGRRRGKGGLRKQSRIVLVVILPFPSRHSLVVVVGVRGTARSTTKGAVVTQQWIWKGKTSFDSSEWQL